MKLPLRGRADYWRMQSTGSYATPKTKPAGSSWKPTDYAKHDAAVKAYMEKNK
jgi:hypothetical protein